MSLLMWTLNRLNCSWLELSGEDIQYGELDGNGSYNKHTGMLQRNELSTASPIYRTDMLQIPAVKLLSYGLPADVIIVSRKNDSYRVNYDLIPLWTSSFDAITVFYFTICCSLFVVIISTIDCIEIRTLAMRWHELPARLVANIRKTAAALIDQQNFDTISAASRLLVWFFNLFILFAIHGIIFSSMGADMVALIDPPIIQSTKEFTNTSFTQPLISKNLIVYHLVKKASPGSGLWPVRQAVERDPDETLLDFTLDTGLDYLPQHQKNVEDINSTKKAFVISDLAFKWGRPFICGANPVVTRKSFRSHESYAHSMYTMALSKDIDPFVAQVFGDFMSGIVESGTVHLLVMKVFRQALINLTGFSLPEKSCDPFSSDDGDDEAISAFGMRIMKPIFEFYGYLTCVSVLLFMTECRSAVCSLIKSFIQLMVTMSLIIFQLMSSFIITTSYRFYFACKSLITLLRMRG
jgi:hypothetical protein